MDVDVRRGGGVLEGLHDVFALEVVVTRAGEIVRLSQPSTSNALARLRRRFDDDLLVRRRRVRKNEPVTVYEKANELAVPPERWYVDLVCGDTLEILAHSYSIEGSHHVFSLLFKGLPNFEVTTLRISSALVAGTRG